MDISPLYQAMTDRLHWPTSFEQYISWIVGHRCCMALLRQGLCALTAPRKLRSTWTLLYGRIDLCPPTRLSLAIVVAFRRAVVRPCVCSPKRQPAFKDSTR